MPRSKAKPKAKARARMAPRANTKAAPRAKAKAATRARAKAARRTKTTTQRRARSKTARKARSALTISKAAEALLAEFEVGGRAAYEERYSRPNTPHGYPGVMIAVAYDVGEHTVAGLRRDCKGILDDATITRLEPACGVHGAEAEPLARGLQDIVITWEQAVALARKAIIPKWIGIVRKHLPNASELNPDSLGALVSLTFNRGPCFSSEGDRFREMRAIRQHMAKRAYQMIPNELRAMKRLWPTLEALQRRREREAELFERGLA